MMVLSKKCSCLYVDSSVVGETQNESRVLVDIREPSSFKNSHIRGAANMYISKLLMRRLHRGSLSIRAFLPLHLKKTLDNDLNLLVVVYDDDRPSENEFRAISVVGLALRKEFPTKNICLLNSAFDEFRERYPSQCEFGYQQSYTNPFKLTFHEKQRNISRDPTDACDVTDTLPVPILPYMFLGNSHHSTQKDVLDNLGITAILNVSRTCPMLFSDHYEYKTIAIYDNEHENISLYFDEAIEFIDEIEAKNGKVLVHCRAGISRSATICLAYLIRKQGFTLDKAYEYTKQRRTNISPNLNFLGQLLKLENQTTQEQSCIKIPTVTSKAPSTPRIFSYSPKNCVYSNLNLSTNNGHISPLQVLLTPS